MAIFLFRLLTATSVAVLLSLPLTAGAATITVTETADSFDNTGCSLREAIEEVNSGGSYASGCVASGSFGTDDTLNLTATQPYVLSIDGPGDDTNAAGDLDVFTSINIVGLGSGQTSITASGFSAGQEDRVLHITQIPAGATPITVNLQGLTVRDGDSSTTGDGGGISVTRPEVNLNLIDVTVTDNVTEENGGGISLDSDGGLMTLTNSRVVNNDSPDDAGGIDIINGDAVAQLIDSTVDGNESTDDGGGIRNFGGLLVINSTISRNTAVFTEDGDQGQGGGIYNTGEMVLINTTVSGNTARVDGGGIYSLGNLSDGGNLQNVQALLFNVTIADNTAEVGFGGGVCHNCEVQPQGPPPVGLEFRVANTLIAQNTAPTGPDCTGQDPFVSSGYNLIGDDADCNGFAATGDQTNVSADIGPLQNNVGPTETHALLTGSLAIDRGNDVAGCQSPVIADLFVGTLTLQPLTEDQRGLTRPVAILDPAVAICDIGAYELQVEEPTPSPTATPVPPPGPSLLEGSGCALNPASQGSGAAILALLAGMGALVAAWRGFGLSRK